MGQIFPAHKRHYVRGFLHGTVGVVIVIVLLGILLWSVGAIYFSNLPSEDFRAVAAIFFGAAWIVAFAVFRNRLRTTLVFLATFAVLLVWWSTISPSHDRNWRPEVARLPRAEIHGDLVTIRNVRDFDYRSENDFTVRYKDKTYDLNDIRTVDLVLSHWDDIIVVGHMILSFGFGNGDYISVSVETRLEKGEPQSAIRGLFKQYELIYVLAEERDVIRLRTSFRNEDVYLYPTRATSDEVRALFLDIVKRVNQIAERPEFYNTFVQNCSTALVPHIEKVRGPRDFDPRMLLNGFSDKMAYDRGVLDTDLSFAGTKARHYINQYVRHDDRADGYSRRIRPHLTPQSP